MYDPYDGTMTWGRDAKAIIATDTQKPTPSGMYARIAVAVVRRSKKDMAAFLDAEKPCRSTIANALDAAAWVRNGTALDLLQAMNEDAAAARYAALQRMAVAVLSKSADMTTAGFQAIELPIAA